MVNVSDVGNGIDTITINDTTNFKITLNGSSGDVYRTGTIENNTLLAIGSYSLNVTANDTLGVTNITRFFITVQDTTAPTWNQTPTNQAVTYTSPFSYQVNASDPSGLGLYSLNATSNFTINSSTGLIENSTGLVINTILTITISVNDTYGNILSATITITVQDPTPYGAITVNPVSGGTEFKDGEVANIGIQVVNASNSPVTSATCKVSIFSPDMVALVSSAAIPYQPSTLATYTYAYTIPDSEGVYTWEVECNSTDGYADYAGGQFHNSDWSNKIKGGGNMSVLIFGVLAFTFLLLSVIMRFKHTTDEEGNAVSTNVLSIYLFEIMGLLMAQIGIKTVVEEIIEDYSASMANTAGVGVTIFNIFIYLYVGILLLKTVLYIAKEFMSSQQWND